MFDSADIPTPDQPVEAFAAVIALRRLASTLERSTVDHALTQGWTWNQIGQALGMTAQAAHKRLSPTRRTARDQKGTT
ncbi:sigma-70 family RNA polymerase sigma factor [Cryobacterium fucosi]|uniref:Sigma-70 family RNA polymerase sigma factor n=1 Tax=Cryobacterium fucosi TaxID=1259157 RepID=A0A4R9B661_9MICO|nr:sigma-70 family RNA polymerase sigma factor [Cryobacterium fucosi]TFD76277.1 sigma-70 family RNA polymerase sigma factor [Cryobacterium fucosi]